MPEQDTVSLEEVEVYAPALDRFAEGQKIVQLGKRELLTYSGRSLGDLLQEQSPVFVRQYGAGMLASPSFRGTSAGHTAVFWNGLPINSPSLGQSDLSILPVAGIDRLGIHYGSGGALFGNEAIGGSLHLETKPEFGKGFTGQFSQQIGSFGLFNSRLSGQFSSEKFTFQTKVYREFTENDFPYQDLSQPGTPEIRQEHARFEQRGIVQDVAWNIAEKSQLKTSIWWNQAEREVQPVMGSRTQDIQQDQNLRAVLDYFRFGQKSVLNLKTGFVRDNQLFNSTSNATSLFLLGGDWDYAFSEKWTSRSGARFTLAAGDLSTYEAREDRLELYQSTRFVPAEKLAISLNLRQLIYSGAFAPFTPSIGLDWGFWEKENQGLKFKASLGRGFKVPTLNDRFWNPGGNPNLLPEQSWNGELGLHFIQNANISLTQSLTYYRMNVNNWIIWLPQGSIWSPENIREVRNQGVEYQGKSNWKTGTWNWELGLSYTFSEALDLTSDATQPQQLPYTPRHQANGTLKTEVGRFWVNLGTFYVGERAVGTGNSRVLNGFQLWNTSVGFSGITWGKVRLPLSFQVLNLFDKDYQVLYLRAMPGRSYQFNLILDL